VYYPDKGTAVPPIVAAYAAQFPEEDVEYWQDPPTMTTTHYFVCDKCTEKDKYISHLEGEVEDLRETIQALLEAVKALANSG
jgi:hypothetical protein